jgi:peptide/nickel transport system substrate-binding protein
MIVNKPEIPFYDIKVRQALNMAVDKQAIVDDYYGGKASLVVHPFPPGRAYGNLYTPFEEMPTEPSGLVERSVVGVKELFIYNPEKAKQLLSDAGYAGGFKFEVPCDTANSDYLAIIKSYLDQIGMEMTILPMEAGMFRRISNARDYDAAIFTGSPTALFPWKMHSVRAENPWCPSFCDYEYSRNIYNEVNKNFAIDNAKVAELLKQNQLFELETATAIWLPGAQTYTVWWPWVQNYTGENIVGYYNEHGYLPFIWVDEELKESLGY